MVRSTKAASETSSRRSNLLAILISCLGIGVLYVNFDPHSVGSDPQELAADNALPNLDIEVPMPIDLDDPLPISDVAGEALIASDEVSDDNDVVETTAEMLESTADQRCEIRGRFAMLTLVLLLERGREFLASLPSYEVTFSKRERIGGEMMDQQVIDLKVRHEPFSLYMKWRVGDKGRQLLYVDGQNDGRAVVKLGGLKGRFLPAINIDPAGSRALAESRHPITNAGMLSMTEKIIDRRRMDLERGSGLNCRLIDNQTFGDRTCYCFVAQWDPAKRIGEYRKTVIMTDKTHSVPIAIRNYQWAEDTEGMSPEELDEFTLIEDYSFCDVCFETKLAAESFEKSTYRIR